MFQLFQKFIKLSLVSCILLLSVLSISAKAANRRDELPKLSDTLAVAKSPFEPITLATSLPGARNDNLPIPSEPALDKSNDDQFQVHRQSTRAVQATSEQEKETTASNGMSESSGLDMTSLTPSASGDTSSETSTSTEPSEEASTTVNPIDITTTVKEELDKQPSVTTDTPQPTTTTTTTAPIQTTTSTTTTGPILAESSATSSNSDPASEKVQTTTLAPTTTISILKVVVEETTPEPDKSSSITDEPTSSTEPAPSSDATTITTITTTTAAPSTTTTSTTTTTLTPTTTTTAAVDQPTSADTEGSSSSSSKEIEGSTTTLAPKPTVAETPAVAGEQASSTTSTTLTSSETTTQSSVDKKDEEKKEEDKQSCNHLPTYEAEEIQKVFREETTYKNGTIKGKFTYINFDQRYRLVHYTRLPYGPVKIDLVEELGRPEQTNSNQSSPTSNSSSNEVPNAVLQLRNIIPNSLFGFPFIGPQQANNKPIEHKTENEDDKSNTYFYSTDTISTPNLLTPSVPVSLLPGQRKFSNQQPLQSYVETANQSPVDSSSTQSAALEAAKLIGSSSASNHDQKVREGVLFGSPANQHQFQYATLALQAAEPSKSGLLYSYHTQQQHPTSSQYQYSPLPLYSFHQPNYYSARQSISPPQQVAFNKPVKSDNNIHSEPLSTPIGHQMHQPHSHQHYVAPFMFSQPPGINNDQPEASRLRLRVKTAKALNGQQETFGKSAQLRASHGGIYSAPINSPVQNHRLQHRQRSGKQNQELRSTVNTSPVVYHVLRSPVGRMYNLPQYNQEYAMAYDHND